MIISGMFLSAEYMCVQIEYEHTNNIHHLIFLKQYVLLSVILLKMK